MLTPGAQTVAEQNPRCPLGPSLVCVPRPAACLLQKPLECSGWPLGAQVPGARIAGVLRQLGQFKAPIDQYSDRYPES